MACATCDHTMQKVSDPAWWCPRCGTIKDHVQQQPTDRERIAELERRNAQLEKLDKATFIPLLERIAELEREVQFLRMARRTKQRRALEDK